MLLRIGGIIAADARVAGIRPVIALSTLLRALRIGNRVMLLGV